MNMQVEKLPPRGKFGPWDLYRLNQGQWEIEATYYYWNDIPKDILNAAETQLVLLGEDPVISEKDS